MPKYNASKAVMPQNSKAVRKLIDIGLIPEQCTRFELVIDAKDAIRAKCEFVVTEDQAEKIAAAFAENPEEVAQVIRTARIKVADFRVGHREMEKIPDLVF